MNEVWLYGASAGLTALVTLAFLAVFVREPWTKHPFGQSVMVLSVGVLLLSCLGLAVYIFGPNYPGREYAVLTGRLLITVAMGQRLVVLIRARRKDRNTVERFARTPGDPR